MNHAHRFIFHSPQDIPGPWIHSANQKGLTNTNHTVSIILDDGWLSPLVPCPSPSFHSPIFSYVNINKGAGSLLSHFLLVILCITLLFVFACACIFSAQITSVISVGGWESIYYCIDLVIEKKLQIERPIGLDSYWL